MPEFSSSETYWQERYIRGGTSGAGSYGHLAEFKAFVINRFCDEKLIRDVIEFGCGDGNQLQLMRYKNYLGLDISEKSIDICKKKFLGDTTKRFRLMSEHSGSEADLALSLDVIYHLVEDDVFEDHMKQLFSSAKKFVIIYSSNFVESKPHPSAKHILHRRFTDWIESNISDFTLIDTVQNAFPFDSMNPKRTTFADFYIYERVQV